MIKCDKANCDGNMFILYDRIGLTYYQCDKCDNKKSKFEIEQEQQDQANSKQVIQQQQANIDKKINDLKAIYENEIYGYSEIKSLICDIVDTHIKNLTDKPTHLLLCGASGTSKTFFFELLQKCFDSTIVCMIDCSHLSGSGLVSYLNETGSLKTLSFIILDELDKLPIDHQKKLLVALENGILSEKKYKRNISLDVSNVLFFATGNEKTKIYDPLLNRFTTLDIPQYTYEQYRQITDSWIKKKCPNSYIDICSILFPNHSTSEMIQIRTLKKLVDLSLCNPNKLKEYLNTIDKYSN